MSEYRICHVCLISHYENCGTCVGFGVYKSLKRPGEWVFVSAGEAHDKVFAREVFPCPECGSTENGVPEKAKA